MKGAGLQVFNLYNQKDKNSVWTVDSRLFNLPILPEPLVLGNLNTQHQSWDSSSQLNSQRENDLWNWIEDSQLLLRNEPNVGTFYRPQMDSPSVLNLTLAKALFQEGE
jgi:hypothetical protein